MNEIELEFKCHIHNYMRAYTHTHRRDLNHILCINKRRNEEANSHICMACIGIRWLYAACSIKTTYTETKNLQKYQLKRNFFQITKSYNFLFDVCVYLSRVILVIVVGFLLFIPFHFIHLELVESRAPFWALLFSSLHTNRQYNIFFLFENYLLCLNVY